MGKQRLTDPHAMTVANRAVEIHVGLFRIKISEKNPRQPSYHEHPGTPTPSTVYSVQQLSDG